MNGIRQPAAYGFYPPGEDELKDSLQACFLDNHGLGKIPKLNSERKGNVVAGVAPHAGFIYSGPIASHIYGFLADDGFPETFILIGPKHGYMRLDGAAIMSKGAWVTPLGKCPIDNHLGSAILKNGQSISPPCIIESSEAHMGEHSLEVQLPFLQFLSGSKPVQILPLLISTPNFSACKHVGEAIAEAIKQTNCDATIIASTDFTHYGAHFYNYAPVGSGPIEKVTEWVHDTDADLIRKIENMDGKALLNTVVEKHRTMCGASGVATMLVAAKFLGAKQGKLLKYATSYDVRGSSDAIVGYGAIAITK
jgi:AmmeMemoRadiSam system protein B